MLTFEIRKYVGGRWVLDAVFDDKTTAVEEAQSLIERSNALPAVRVVAVSDGADGFREWTVFKQSIVDGENEAAVQVASQARREVDNARTQRQAPAKRPQKRAPPKRRGWVYYAGMAMRVVAIIGGGIGALLLLQRQFM
jgi:hypothetical protein